MQLVMLFTESDFKYFSQKTLVASELMAYLKDLEGNGIALSDKSVIKEMNFMVVTQMHVAHYALLKATVALLINYRLKMRQLSKAYNSIRYSIL